MKKAAIITGFVFALAATGWCQAPRSLPIPMPDAVPTNAPEAALAATPISKPISNAVPVNIPAPVSAPPVVVAPIPVAAPAVAPSPQTVAPTFPSSATAAGMEQEPAVRDPFWPIGYLPPSLKPLVSTNTPPPAVVDQPLKWDEAVKALAIKGVLKSGKGGYLAIINNQVMGPDDVISLIYQARRYSWKIESITPKGVKFERLEDKPSAAP